MSTKDIRRLAVTLAPLIEIADTLDKYESVASHVEELTTRAKILEDVVAKAKADADNILAKAQTDAALLRSEAKAIKEQAQDAANTLVADAKAEAIAVAAKAKGEARALLDVARGKVVEHEAKAKTLEGVIAKLTADADEVEARLAKAKESIAKMLG